MACDGGGCRALPCGINTLYYPWGAGLLLSFPRQWRPAYTRFSGLRGFDTVGAGDSHCGALIACLKEGMSLDEACLGANTNRTGAAVAGIRGAVLDTLPDSLRARR